MVKMMEIRSKKITEKEMGWNLELVDDFYILFIGTEVTVVT
jgi:hypothetical protein